MLGSKVTCIAVFAHLNDHFELSRRVHGTMSIQRESQDAETDSYCTMCAEAHSVVTHTITVGQS